MSTAPAASRRRHTPPAVLATLRKSHHQAGGGRLHAGCAGGAPDRLGGRRAGAVERQRGRAHVAALRPGQPSSLRRPGGGVQRPGPAGVAHALAADAVSLDTDPPGASTCSGRRRANADDFSRNLIRARCEGRFATSVYSPLGVVTADLSGLARSLLYSWRLHRAATSLAPRRPVNNSPKVLPRCPLLFGATAQRGEARDGPSFDSSTVGPSRCRSGP